MDSVHRLLHAARESLELSQSDVAKATGVSTRTLHRMENDLGMVGFDILGKLRSYFESLGVTLISPADDQKWAMTFKLDLAPAPGPDVADKIYDPVPGRVLKAARILAGMTQAELASNSHVAHTTVRRIEKGDGKGSVEKVYVLQRFLEDRGVQFLKPQGEKGWSLRR
ncbi:helix-turn-helix domain-containing protein [Rhizobium leguminosarum]|uniref:helix-turn-helix domain-containing protein n=1 Tax=Rhizobium leguminosarum TaxID=384 RepID=UPI0014427C69|nr:helix-turn-helix transcriptional regulator [Rhizobium leguminosarum]NKN00584.1 helix-turn-helix domain-containing protein [Rhizobium leguminosarum bv. viciae]